MQDIKQMTSWILLPMTARELYMQSHENIDPNEMILFFLLHIHMAKKQALRNRIVDHGPGLEICRVISI